MKKFKYNHILLFAVSVLLFVTCKKAVKDDPLWVNIWSTSGGGTVIDIDKKSGASYTRYSTVSSATSSNSNGNGGINYTTSTSSNDDGKSHKGKARIRNGKLYIGTKSFRIDQGPESKGGCTTIVIDGVTYSANRTGTCWDGIKNDCEEDVDCGGICYPCNICGDGMKNQDEEAVDCGGTCYACVNLFYYETNDSTTLVNTLASKRDSINGKYYFLVQNDEFPNNDLFRICFNKILSVGTFNVDINGSYIVRQVSNGTYDHYYCTSGQIAVTNFRNDNGMIFIDGTYSLYSNSLFVKGNFKNVYEF